jgi:subtilisin family serine protease
MHPDVISAGGAYIDEDLSLQASDYASAFSSIVYPGRAVPDVAGLVGMQPDADYIMLPLAAGCEIDQGGSAHDGTAHDDGWAVISGTSAAAPQIAGVIALLKQQDPALSPAEHSRPRTSRQCYEPPHATSPLGTPTRPPTRCADPTDR